GSVIACRSFGPDRRLGWRRQLYTWKGRSQCQSLGEDTAKRSTISVLKRYRKEAHLPNRNVSNGLAWGWIRPSLIVSVLIEEQPFHLSPVDARDVANPQRSREIPRRDPGSRLLVRGVSTDISSVVGVRHKIFECDGKDHRLV